VNKEDTSNLLTKQNPDGSSSIYWQAYLGIHTKDAGKLSDNPSKLVNNMYKGKIQSWNFELRDSFSINQVIGKI
jgi:hypothetical protein